MGASLPADSNCGPETMQDSIVHNNAKYRAHSARSSQFADCCFNNLFDAISLPFSLSASAPAWFERVNPEGVDIPFTRNEFDTLSLHLLDFGSPGHVSERRIPVATEVRYLGNCASVISWQACELA